MMRKIFGHPALLIRWYLGRVQIGEPKKTKARKRKFAGFFAFQYLDNSN
jgi:hypothetical protein